MFLSSLPAILARQGGVAPPVEGDFVLLQAGGIDRLLVQGGQADYVLLVEESASLPAVAAVDDTIGSALQADATAQYAVLANDTYAGTPSISIVAQTGAVASASVVGTGASSQIEVIAGSSAGTATITYELTATGSSGSDQAVLSVPVEASGPLVPFSAGTPVHYQSAGAATSHTVQTTVAAPGQDRLVVLDLIYESKDRPTPTSVSWLGSSVMILASALTDGGTQGSYVRSYYLHEASLPGVGGSYQFRVEFPFAIACAIRLRAYTGVKGLVGVASDRTVTGATYSSLALSIGSLPPNTLVVESAIGNVGNVDRRLSPDVGSDLTLDFNGFEPLDTSTVGSRTNHFSFGFMSALSTGGGTVNCDVATANTSTLHNEIVAVVAAFETNGT